MRKHCGALVGVFVASITLTGCGEGGGGTTETVPFKATNADQFKDMLPTKPADNRTKGATPPAGAADKKK